MVAKTQTAKSNKSSGSARKTSPSIEFTLIAPDAHEVYLVGDFNNWEGDGYRMRKFKDGTCKKKVKLKPGRYEYRFIVDGDWWTDPANSVRHPNGFGSENSIITVSE